jgi:hypothetical protein
MFINISIYIIMALIESILVIIVVVIVLVIIYNIFFTKTDLLISGIVPTTPVTAIQASKLQSNISSNFAWSIWFYVNEWNNGYGENKLLFYQADQQYTSATGRGADPPNILSYLDPYENNMTLNVNTYNTAAGSTSSNDYVSNSFVIKNVDLQKWVNLIISVEGRTLDIYLHGKLVQTYVLPNTAYIKNENVYIGGDASQTFDGHVARLQYFANSLNTQQAYNIYRDGIDSNLISDFFNKYKLKIQFLEYNTPVGSPLVF